LIVINNPVIFLYTIIVTAMHKNLTTASLSPSGITRKSKNETDKIQRNTKFWHETLDRAG